MYRRHSWWENYKYSNIKRHCQSSENNLPLQKAATDSYFSFHYHTRIKIPAKNSLFWHISLRGKAKGLRCAVKIQTTRLNNYNPFLQINNGVVEDFG